MSNVQDIPIEKISYCSHCRKDMAFHTRPVNHSKELLRSLFTLGLWLPIWLGMALVRPKFCDGCGNPLSED